MGPRDRVYFGSPNGERTLGEIVKVNPSRYKVRQLEERGGRPIGTLWNVPKSLCTPELDEAPTAHTVPAAPKPKRAEQGIMHAIRYVYGALSPENLYADGLRSRSAALRVRASFNRQLRELFVELGRKVDEDQAYRYFEAERAAQAPAPAI